MSDDADDAVRQVNIDEVLAESKRLREQLAAMVNELERYVNQLDAYVSSTVIEERP
jgi:hypothetical protein